MWPRKHAYRRSSVRGTSQSRGRGICYVRVAQTSGFTPWPGGRDLFEDRYYYYRTANRLARPSSCPYEAINRHGTLQQAST